MDATPTRGNESQAVERLALLYALVDHVKRGHRPEQLYREAVRGLRRVLPADLCVLLTREGAELRAQASAGAVGELERRLEAAEPWSVDEAEPEPVSLCGRDLERSPDPLHQELGRQGIRSLLMVPVLDRGRLAGELVVGRATTEPFSDADVGLVDVVSGHVGLALWRARSEGAQSELLRRFEAERSVLDSVVNQMPAGVLLAAVPTGRIITSNPQIRAIWGRTLRQTTQVSDYGLWGGVDAEGQPLEPEAWPLARSVLHGARIRGEEVRIERADGSRRVIRMSSTPVVDALGNQLAAVATVTDVTRELERERRHEYLERATQTLGASIELGPTLDAVVRAVVGPFADWSVLYRRDRDRVRATASAHVEEEGQARVRPFAEADLVLEEGHPLQRALRDRAPLLLAPATADPVGALCGRDARLRDAATDLGCEGVLLLPLVCRDRELGVLAVVRSRGRYAEEDVDLMMELAPRAALAVDNALLYEQARAADRAKANFLAVMSHEFRTPLSAILGYADILTARVHGDLTPRQANHLDRVKASVRHLSHLVDEILAFASMEAGRERVSRGPTDLRELVRDATAIMDPIADAAGLSLRVETPDEELVVETDASKVRQIVINLVSNAIKYTPEGTVSIELEVDAGAVRCHVTDTGPGIAPEHREQVFEPFWQVERAKDRITGTGLGLAVARRLARLLDGDVLLDSTVGSGSRFTVILPITYPGTESGTTV